MAKPEGQILDPDSGMGMPMLGRSQAWKKP